MYSSWRLEARISVDGCAQEECSFGDERSGSTALFTSLAQSFDSQADQVFPSIRISAMNSYNRWVMGRLNTLSLGWLFDGMRGPSDRLLPRWIFLRALGAVYFSAFFSLAFQIRGLIGPKGILPAGNYLQAVAQALGHVQRIWYAPTVLWWSSSTTVLNALCWLGMLAALLLVLNVWPRGMLVLCFVLFLSVVSAAQDFSGYQSDGMLLEAGFLSLFFAPRGFWPRIAACAC